MTVQELESAIGAAIDRVGPAVVSFAGGRLRGCGTVIGAGKVITNAHNLRQEEVSVRFSDGRSAVGRVAGTDPDLDLAVVDVDTADVAPVLRPDEAAGQLQVGRAVLAVANPGGRGLHLAPGFVSSLTASFRGPRGRILRGAIEHTAPLPRGSSGGPLVDLQGRLVGINSVRLDPGLVIAVPVLGQIAQRVESLIGGERRRAVRLGIAVASPRAAHRLRAAVGLPPHDGVLVRAVQAGTPADRAGLRRGDLIVAAQGAPLEGVDRLYDVLDSTGQDGRLELAVLRGTEEHSMPVELVSG